MALFAIRYVTHAKNSVLAQIEADRIMSSSSGQGAVVEFLKKEKGPIPVSVGVVALQSGMIVEKVGPSEAEIKEFYSAPKRLS